MFTLPNDPIFRRGLLIFGLCAVIAVLFVSAPLLRAVELLVLVLGGGLYLNRGRK